jgi:hypothetical protein
MAAFDHAKARPARSYYTGCPFGIVLVGVTQLRERPDRFHGICANSMPMPQVSVKSSADKRSEPREFNVDRQLRRLPCWRRIRHRPLPHLRKVI